MSHWPEQPINIITKWLMDHSPALIVADFGCGENFKPGSFIISVYIVVDM